MSHNGPFDKWEKLASVRASPMRVLKQADDYHFFSASVSPLLSNHYIKALNADKIRYLEIQLLYKYLSFTEYLETQIVNGEILKISNDTYQLGFSKKVRIDAYKIYCDEAYHALQAADMKSQIEQVTGIAPLHIKGNLTDRLDLLKEQIHPAIRPYFDLLFVAVSESLVSQELNGYVKDRSIHPEIRSLIKDHAKDEIKHAIFFKVVLSFLNNKLGKDEFQHFVSFVPEFLRVYLIPAESDMMLILEQVVCDDTRNKIFESFYGEMHINEFLARSAENLNKTLYQIQHNN